MRNTFKIVCPKGVPSDTHIVRGCTKAPGLARDNHIASAEQALSYVEGFLADKKSPEMSAFLTKLGETPSIDPAGVLSAYLEETKKPESKVPAAIAARTQAARRAPQTNSLGMNLSYAPTAPKF